MRTVSLVLVLSLIAPLAAQEAAPEPKLDKAMTSKVKKSIDRGLAFLRAAWDEEFQEARAESDGAMPTHVHWGHPGITGLCLSAFYRAPRKYTNADGPFLQQPYDYLLSIQREDGAINDQPGLDNYITSVAMMALIDSGEEVQDVLDRAAAFLTKEQLDEEEGYRPGDQNYGGQGYGSSQRPDLSNTQLAAEALHEYGLPADHPFFQKAMTFVSRCQNNSETNDLDKVRAEDGNVYVFGNDGGFIYSPSRTEAGVIDNGDGTVVPRSYGSMTYAAIKSMVYADLSADDPRVAAAMDWISNNYRLDENPGGAGLQGLFYYYNTFSKALAAAGVDEIVDADEVSHNWRNDLAQALLSRQRADGAWVNSNARWMESNPVLVTAYSVVALIELLEE